MKNTITLTFCLFLLGTQAQVTFKKYPVPMGSDNKNYRLVVDYFSDQQILFPVKQEDTIYVKSIAGGNFIPKDYGLCITAFYANNGDLFLVKNTNRSGYEPHLYKSSNNGSSFAEISGVLGRDFHKDQFGTLFYSIAGGFAFSTDNGANFKTVTTPDTVFCIARNEAGTLYFMDDSVHLYKSTNDGDTWQNISKTFNHSHFREHHLWAVSDTLFFQTASGFHYTLENGTKWSIITPSVSNSIVTNVHVSPDRVFYCMSAYGFFETTTPISNTWKNLLFTLGPPQESIYNHYIGITDSSMYWITDTGYVYASRIPNFVGINEIKPPKFFSSIFPNPANTEISVITNENNAEFSLYNIHGEAVLRETISFSEQLVNLRSVTPGIYFWNIGNAHGKLLVQ